MCNWLKDHMSPRPTALVSRHRPAGFLSFLSNDFLGRRNFLPVEPQSGLSFLFLLGAPGFSNTAPVISVWLSLAKFFCRAEYSRQRPWISPWRPQNFFGLAIKLVSWDLS